MRLRVNDRASASERRGIALIKRNRETSIVEQANGDIMRLNDQFQSMSTHGATPPCASTPHHVIRSDRVKGWGRRRVCSLRHTISWFLLRVVGTRSKNENEWILGWNKCPHYIFHYKGEGPNSRIWSDVGMEKKSFLRNVEI